MVFRDTYIATPAPPRSRFRMTTVEIRYNGRSFAPLDGVVRLVGMFEAIGMLRICGRFLHPPLNDSTAYIPETKVSALYSEILNFKSAGGTSDLIRAIRYENTLKSVHMNTMMLDEEWAVLSSVMKSGLAVQLTHLGFSVDWPDVYGPEPGGT